MFQLSLGPSGLRLHLPSGRHLDFGEDVNALPLIKRVLMQEGQEPRKGHIGSFPTQAIVDKWLRDEAPAKREREAEAAMEAASDRLGIDLGSLDFSL